MSVRSVGLILKCETSGDGSVIHEYNQLRFCHWMYQQARWSCLKHFRSVIQTTKLKVASKAAVSRVPPAAAISVTSGEPPSQQQSKKKGGPNKADDSDTDPDAPVAQQMLSFVMDDPDFESEASDTPRIAKVKRQKRYCFDCTYLSTTWPFFLLRCDNACILPRMDFRSGMSFSLTCLRMTCS